MNSSNAAGNENEKLKMRIMAASINGG